MNKKTWHLIRSEEGADFNILKVRYDYYRNPRNQKVVKTIAITGQDSVNVIACTPADENHFSQAISIWDRGLIH